MLIPYSTDAPIYHYPISTIGLIVVNVFCFICFGTSDLDSIWYLHYGSFNPLEWLTSIFMHFGVIHLVGNMIFLLAFGLIVEGKLGWYRSLLVYLLIGVSQSGLEQTLMLGRSEASILAEYGFEDREGLVQGLIDADHDEFGAELVADMLLSPGASCGASAAIYGLLAICLVWAPKNDFSVCMFIMIRPILFDVSVMWFAIFYIGWELLRFTMFGFSMGSEALHLMGAAIGFGVGTLFLKRDWVDCENWDLFKVLSGKYGRDLDPTVAVGSHADPTLVFGTDVAVDNDAAKPAPRKSSRAQRSSRLQHIESLIDANSIMEATEAMYALQMQDDSAQLDRSRLKKLAQGQLAAGMTDDAELYLEEYIERFPDDAAWARVRCAEVYVASQRPSAALLTLKQVRLSQLSEKYQALAKRTVRDAKRLIADGVEDAEPEW